MNVWVQLAPVLASNLTVKAVRKQPDIVITGVVGKRRVEPLAERAPRRWVIVKETTSRADD